MAVYKGISFEFMDVGMGDGTLVELPPAEGGENWLVDFGERGSPFKTPASDATLFLVSRIKTNCDNRGKTAPFLDVLVITHPDSDHWNKLDWLIEGRNENAIGLWEKVGYKAGTKLAIGTLIFGGEWSTYQSSNPTLAKLITDNTGKIWGLANADHDVSIFGTVTPRWKIDGTYEDAVKIYLLSSNLPGKSGGDPNPKSIVLMFEYNGAKVMLTGDSESRYVEPAILAAYPAAFLKCVGLKLGHHGSAASSSTEFLAAVQPQVVFASGDRRWGHPYCDAITRAKPYLGSFDNRWYSCSFSGSENDYVSSDVKQQICTNLWYVVTQKDGITLKGPDGNDHWCQQGTYTGVQWVFQIIPKSAGNNTIYVSHTDAWPNA